jgi:hypothetical protein
MGTQQERLWTAIRFVVAFVGVLLLLPDQSLTERLIFAVLLMFAVMGILRMSESLKSWDERASERDNRERRD